MHFAIPRHIKSMRNFLFVTCLGITALAQATPALPLNWNLLWAGSWEEGGALHNRGDFRLDLAPQGLLLRAQVLDRRALDPGADRTWAEFSERTAGGASLGLYHGATGSRVLYGALFEQGLPSRIRNPWSRAVPFAENRRPTRADLRTTGSSTSVPEAYLYLSGPHLALFGNGTLPEISLRGFASAQVATEGNPRPAFSGGVEAFRGTGSVSVEGFFTGTRLEARESSTWFSGSPSLPGREFRLWAASLKFDTPRLLLASDMAMSSAFAYGNGFYGNVAVRLRRSPGICPWSLSFAVEGMGERYVGRGGEGHSGGFRAGGRIERRGPRGSLFRADTALRASVPDAPFDRSFSGVSYRFATPSARAMADGGFSLRVSRVSFNARRDAFNSERIRDSVNGTLGLSLGLPPMPLPSVLLPPRSRRASSGGAGVYPVGIGLSAALGGRDSRDGVPSPYPLFPLSGEFDSFSVGCELRWSPGILQLRTRWTYTRHSGGDGNLDGSFSVAVRFGRGRFGARVGWPGFQEKPEYAFSWRLEI